VDVDACPDAATAHGSSPGDRADRSAVGGEFELIRRHFVRDRGPRRARLGVGDDCALIDPPVGETLAVSTDMLVEGRHFFPDVDAAALGHKALAVNLSDLAAMGACPIGFTLALALPRRDDTWLHAFAGGLFALADEHDCELVGGDTTRGPLNLCITVFGGVPAALALRRDGARGGDDLWVSGTLGAAAWAVACRVGSDAAPAGDDDLDRALALARQRLDRPQPRVALGVALRGLASAAIDLSDGLVGDLDHVLERSSLAAGAPLGASLAWPSIPVDRALDGLAETRRAELALAGGDDYELLFAAQPARRAAVVAAAAACGVAVSRIGCVEHRAGIRLLDAGHRPMAFHARAFDHFR
jgi:thiamine-monophosphate kinase